MVLLSSLHKSRDAPIPFLKILIISTRFLVLVNTDIDTNPDAHADIKMSNLVLSKPMKFNLAFFMLVATMCS